ncbi:oligosaccharide flippase family protein [Arhodomonas sp. AD133]|uniref:oligosaccharide flippase family protein n=1 Tax=Arhodomonas sp. AD133 TaxID=3415009 RepID=UPI003EB7010F
MSTATVSSLLNRSLILAFGRASNYAILLISPIILTRVLPVELFGQYREFILYGVLLTELLRFAIGQSLTYLIPRDPGNERVFVSQSVVFTLAVYFVGVGLIIVASGVSAMVEYPYMAELLVYVFFLLNLDFVIHYWLAKGQSFHVFVYGCVRLVVRVGSVVVVAVWVADLQAIVWTLIFVEAARFTAVLVYLSKNRLLTLAVSRRTMAEQLRFFVPLGFSNGADALNKYVGQLFVSLALGPSVLALYVIGTYTAPLLNLCRSSVGDAVFPRMSEKGVNGSGETLRLWQRTTIVYTFLLAPLIVFIVASAESIVVVLFSDSYRAAAPVLQVFSLAMLKDCVDFGLPLRALGRTRTILASRCISLAINIGLMMVFVHYWGLLGPAIALLVTQFLIELYLGWRLVDVAGVAFARLCPWGEIGRIVAMAMMSGVVFAGAALTEWPRTVELAVFGMMFGLVYAASVRAMGITEIDRLTGRVVGTLRHRLVRRHA